MIAYFQAGLYILASDTKAQKKFMENHPEHGRIAALDHDEFNIAKNELIQKKDLIRAGAEKRFEMAKEYCWEKEGEKLMKLK